MIAQTIRRPKTMAAAPDAAWQRHLGATLAAALALAALFFADARDMATIWWTSSTFEHCLFIPPIIAWMVWQRRAELARLVPQAWPLALLGVAAGASCWIVGQAAGVALARHLGLVVMLQATVAACLGRAVTRGVLFPLGYALFLVPFGEELVPPLQTLTAKLSMGLLALAGVPAHIEGVFITIAGGSFEVAEACSGVKFLVAMAALGALVANLCFRSPWRRAGFVAAALVVPVLANGIRAWATIYIASLSGVAFAASFDHVVYGWFFFAAVIAATLLAGWPFFDRPLGSRWFDPARLQRSDATSSPPRAVARIALAALTIAAAPVLWTEVVAARGTVDAPDVVLLPDVPGWSRVYDSGSAPWRPRYDGADGMGMQRYVDAAGVPVDLAVAVYERQAEHRELVGYGHGAVDPDSGWAWVDDRPNPPEGRAFRIQTAGQGSSPVVREVETFYRVGDVTTGSEPRVKLETLKTHLLGGPQRAVAVLVSAERTSDGDARGAIDRFRAALGPVDALADRAAGLAPTR